LIHLIIQDLLIHLIIHLIKVLGYNYQKVNSLRDILHFMSENSVNISKST